MKDYLEFITEVPKGSLIKSYKLPGTFGALPGLKSPDSSPIYAILIEGSPSKPGEIHNFFPLEYHRTIEEEYVETIIVGIKFGNPEGLFIQEELKKIFRYLKKTHKIGSSGNREAVKLLIEDMEHLNE